MPIFGIDTYAGGKLSRNNPTRKFLFTSEAPIVKKRKKTKRRRGGI
jgi:hypothetical protein